MVEKHTSAPPAVEEIAKRYSFLDALVFLASEGIGVPLAIAGGEGAANWLWRPAVVGFGLGLPLMALGFIFPRIRNQLSEASRNRIATIATYCTTVVILAAFAYMIGPSIYQQIVFVTTPPLSSAALQQNTPITPAPPPAAPIAPVRVDVTNIAYILPEASPSGHFFVNVFYANRSPNLAVRGFVRGGKILISPKVLTAEEERALAVLYFSKPDFPGENISSEIAPGRANMWYSIESDIGSEQLKPVLDGDSYLYFFTYMRYGDSLSGLMTETDWCGYSTHILNVIHICQTFNRVFSVASPKPYLP